MKPFLDEIVVDEIVNCVGRKVCGRKCFWTKVFLDEFFFCELDESVPNPWRPCCERNKGVEIPCFALSLRHDFGHLHGTPSPRWRLLPPAPDVYGYLILGMTGFDTYLLPCFRGTEIDIS